MAAIGYVSGVATQQAGVGDGIRGMVTIMPAIAGVVEIIGMGLIFNLSKAKTEMIYAELAQRRSKSEGDGEK